MKRPPGREPVGYRRLEKYDTYNPEVRSCPEMKDRRWRCELVLSSKRETRDPKIEDPLSLDAAWIQSAIDATSHRDRPISYTEFIIRGVSASKRWAPQ